MHHEPGDHKDPGADEERCHESAHELLNPHCFTSNILYNLL
jgi:hypothetical protein